MQITSPFSQNRFEYEGRHSYYLPTTLFAQLQPAKPKLLIGSRGSGKTTLLKALCWDEQTSDTTLIKQLPGSFNDRAYIGIYVKLPSIQLTLLDNWLHSSDATIYGALFSFYLELIAVQLIADSLAQISVRNVLSISVTSEQAAVKEWLESSDFLKNVEKPALERSFSSFAIRASLARRSIEQCALRTESPVDVVARFSVGQIATTTAALFKQMGEFCDECAGVPPGTWHFKFCMDEGESLNDRQQRIVRTSVRLAQWPLFPVLSFVRAPDDRTTTNLHQLTLQAADIEQIPLDKMDKAQFKAFAEGVATIRCREASGDSSLTLSVYPFLGALDLNRILHDILTSSESPFARDLLAKAKALSEDTDPTETATSESADEEDQSVSPPIWQAYLFDRLKTSYPLDVSRKAMRRYKSITLRKKMVGAYLSICRELQTSPRYASADMVLEISDNCIRDFLSQLDHLFRDLGRSTKEFLSAPIPHDVQYRALLAASNAKKDSLPASGVQSPEQARRIIEGLAFITASLQASLPDEKHLETPEQGKFALSISGKQKVAFQEVIDLVYDSAEAGFLRVTLDHDSEPRFRVHTSLAPAFGFSYRGAYYDTWIRVEELERLRFESTDDGVRKTAQAILSRLAGDHPRPLLEGME